MSKSKGRQIARRSAASSTTKKIRLVACDRSGLGIRAADERDALAIAGPRKGPDVAVDARRAARLAAINRHGVEIGIARVIRLLPSVRGEEDLPAVRRPLLVCRAELS